ncbi:MAG: hypothetical protein LBT65_10970, partial [Synergistaceae bacterium]|nr:hypothetical protein [Synergistaceae bacterium]
MTRCFMGIVFAGKKFEVKKRAAFFLPFLAVIAAIGFLGTAGRGVAHAALSADDFLPPAQAAAEQRADLLTVKDEASVKTETDPNLGVAVTTAGNLQDAINKLVEEPKKGCQIIRQGPDSGIVFVATGLGTYNPNRTNVIASRIEQRNAYVAAFMDAKSEMAKTVGGFVSRGVNNFDEKIATYDTDEQSLGNMESSLSDEQTQSVRKVLKGYVTYAVLDNGKGMVHVVLVSSPKTRGQYSRSGTDGITAGSLRDGLNSLLAEIRSGLVPPVGGRIIDVPGTGEVAFVGFGSSVVRKNDDPAFQEKLKLQAEQVAGMRAASALAGIILGDDTAWATNADESTRQQVKEFEVLQKSDQTAQGSEAEIKAYQNKVNEMRNVLTTSTKMRSLREGTLPPGVMQQTNL